MSFFIYLGLLIISFIAVISILSKKIINLPEAGEVEIYEASVVEEKYNQSLKNARLLAITNFEKIFRKFRIFFLKIENIFASWAEKFYEKRKSHLFAEKLPFLSSPFFIRHRVKNYEETIDFLNEAELIKEEKKLISNIVDNPKDHISYLKLGIIYFRLKNFEDSKNTFGQVLKLNPSCIEAKMWLGKVEKILPNSNGIKGSL